MRTPPSLANDLNQRLERSEDRAHEIHDKVKSVKDVAADLFMEWEKEIDQYSDRAARRRGRRRQE